MLCNDEINENRMVTKKQLLRPKNVKKMNFLVDCLES